MKSSMSPKWCVAFTPAPAAMFQPVSRREPIGLMGGVKPPPTNPVKRENWAHAGSAAMQQSERIDAIFFITAFSASSLPMVIKKRSGLKDGDTGDAGGSRADTKRRVLLCDAAQCEYGNSGDSHGFAKTIEPERRLE